MRDTLRPSSAAMHMSCHASANLPLAIPGFIPPTSDPNKGQKGVGTEMHAIMESIVERPLAEIMAIFRALEWFIELRMQRRWKTLVEQAVKIDWLVNPVTGKADCILYLKDEIHIIDWKFGKVEVSAVENAQMMSYALAAAQEFAPNAKAATLHIVQPLIESFSSWEVSIDRLEQFQEEMIAADQAIEAGDTTFGPSDHCKFCAANPRSRGDKGNKFCPSMLQLYYPSIVDEAAMLED